MWQRARLPLTLTMQALPALTIAPVLWVFISAAASGEIPTDTRCSITNADAVGAYPISTFTWMIIYKEQNYSDRTKEQAIATLDLLKYILSDEAQDITSEVHYAPLPLKAKELSLENLKRVTYDGVTILE